MYMQNPYPLTLANRHLTVPAHGILINYHPTQDIAVVVVGDRYLMFVDGVAYGAKKSSTVVQLGVSLANAGDVARQQLPVAFTKLTEIKRVRKDVKRGTIPYRITGELPAGAWVTWFHPRVNLCMFDLPDEQGHHEFFMYKGVIYPLAKTDQLFRLDDHTDREVGKRVAQLIRNRQPVFGGQPLDLQLLDNLLTEEQP